MQIIIILGTIYLAASAAIYAAIKMVQAAKEEKEFS